MDDLIAILDGTYRRTNTWKYTCNIKPTLHAGGPLDTIAEAIATQLETQLLDQDYLRFLPTILLLAVRFRAAGAQNDTHAFNLALNDLYDFADQERIWLGNVA